jgi:hypothetical protein
MNKKQDKDFERLEQETGRRLSELPEVKPDPDFQDQLRQRLLAGPAAANTEQPPDNSREAGNRFSPFSMVAAAACLILLAGGWFGFFGPKDTPEPELGPLFLAQARAGDLAGQLDGHALLPGSLGALDQVEFELSATLPPASAEAKVWRLEHGKMNVDEALELAKRMGMENPQVDEGDRHPGQVSIRSDAERLLVRMDQGIWLYEVQTQQPKDGEKPLPLAPPAIPITEDEARAVALDWLEQAGLLPEEGAYECEITQSAPGWFQVSLRRTVTPDNQPVVSSELGIHMLVSSYSGGRVEGAKNIWYPVADSFTTELIDYKQALERLRRGEGMFEAPNFRYYTPGVASVERVELAYYLAYALDFTPYLIPVAVFYGEYAQEGGGPEEFTAYVSLLAVAPVPNAGNFALHVTLPEAPEFGRGIRERDLSVTKAELPALAAFFGLEGEPDDDGMIRGSQGEDLAATSWDGGWFYQGPDRIALVDPSAALVAVEELMAAARTLVLDLPTLPGELGEPVIVATGPGDTWEGVVFPLLYDGRPVIRPGFPHPISKVWVWQVVEVDQTVAWVVNCAQPMELTAEEIPLITPEQAWKKLLQNQSRIHIGGFFGAMPGDRFHVDESRVTGIQLVYVPRHPQLAQNEVYDLMYMFTGESRIGERQVEFVAFVNAES